MLLIKDQYWSIREREKKNRERERENACVSGSQKNIRWLGLASACLPKRLEFKHLIIKLGDEWDRDST